MPRKLRPDQPTDAYIADLAGALTVKDTAALFNLHEKTVYLAINEGRLFAEKRGAPEFVHGGVWLISLTSARLLWGKRNVDA